MFRAGAGGGGGGGSAVTRCCPDGSGRGKALIGSGTGKTNYGRSGKVRGRGVASLVGPGTGAPSGKELLAWNSLNARACMDFNACM